MISGLATPLISSPRKDLLHPLDARGPSALVIVARRLALEALLHQHQARAAGRRFEVHGNLGPVPARAALIFPRPGENEPAGRLDDAVDAARRHGTAVRPAQNHA